MTRQGSMTALRELSRRLHANRMLSMTAIGSARQLYRIPFLNGAIDGPRHPAWRSEPALRSFRCSPDATQTAPG